MENKTKIDINRLDDESIEMTTLIKEKLTNQEFYDMWANMKMKSNQNKQMIEQNKNNIVLMERQNGLLDNQIDKMTKMAKDCEVRLPSKPIKK